MSIATEIQRIQTAKSDLKTAIEAKGVIVEETATIDTYASKVEEIQSGGLPKELEWVNHISSGSTVIDMTSFEDETVILTYPSGAVFNFNALPNYTLKHLTLNFSKPLGSCNKMFFSFGQVNANAGAYALEHLTINADTSKSINFGSFIRSCDIKIIDGTPLDFSSATIIGSFCNRCFWLSYIRIVPNTIKVNADFSGSYSWSDESLDSIVNGLADMTGGETKTLTLHSDVVTRLSEEQATQIYNKNWNID